MENKENKRNKVGLIIVIIIIILLLLFALWFFLFKNKSNATNTNNENGTIEKESTKSNNTEETDLKEGTLIQIVDEEGKPKQNDFVIDGIILVGNRHEYAGLEANTEEIIEMLVKDGYKKEEINSSFYLNEYITFYIDTKYKGDEDDVRILVVPHTDITKLEKMKNIDLESLAFEKGFVSNYVTPDENNYNYVNEGYVSIDYPEGKYDILFTYKDKIAYYLTITETKEPNS